ncbi:hypothetical protein BH18VER2_BH18VER2_15860 [soil metagenome]
MGYVLFELGPALLNPGSRRTQFSGMPGKARMLLTIFGAVLAFGLTALGYGFYQMFTGRRSKRVIYFVVALAAFLMLLAYLL